VRKKFMTPFSILQEPAFHSVEPAQRLLLASDGTLTDVLEAACLESILAAPLSQNMELAQHPFPPLLVSAGEWLFYRDTLLRGRETRIDYVYAAR
jgi:chorismate-pyruvate lyase